MTNFSELLKEANAKRPQNVIAHQPIMNMPARLVNLEKFVEEEREQLAKHVNDLTESSQLRFLRNWKRPLKTVRKINVSVTQSQQHLKRRLL